MAGSRERRWVGEDLVVQVGTDFAYIKVNAGVVFKEGGYLLAAVDNSGVVAVPQDAADLFER